MSKLKLFLLVILPVVLSGFSAPGIRKADDVIGIYWSPKKDAKIEIYKRGNKYYGKTIWGKEPAKDVKNPDPSLRSREVIGLEFLKDFIYDGEEEWIDGTVYDPENGNTYSCKMWLENGDLKLKGYIGFSLFGRTETLERVR